MEFAPHTGPYTGPLPITAAAVARDRLEKYIAEKLATANAYDDEAWAFYTFLLEQAKTYKITYSGFQPSAYKQDEAAAFVNYAEIRKNSENSSPQSDNSRRGEPT
jgi:hypothetical protein